MIYDKKIIELRTQEGKFIVNLNVEIADTQEKREMGLKFRNSLGEMDGMLFVFPTEDNHGFWMKDTSISLDLIFFNSDKKVVDIFKNMPVFFEETRYPKLPCLFVLEVQAGFCEKHEIVEGCIFDY